MQQYKDYTIEKKKSLGAFYTPNTLADYLAKVTLSLCKNNASKEHLVLDPATGDSALLIAASEVALKKNIALKYRGIDIEKDAIERSQDLFAERELDASFILADALFPVLGETSAKGWEELLNKHFPNGVDFIVCNPPWGVEKIQYSNLAKEFSTAIGQFDIYDIFIEKVIDILNDEGCYGIIVPDSIYCEEHTPIRKFLLENTTIKRIVRLGEGVFPGINIAVSLIFGIKKSYTSGNVICSHLTNTIKKEVVNNCTSINDAVELCANKVSQRLMISEGYCFMTDIKPSDNRILNILREAHKIKDVAQSRRGVELSKKGIVLKCSSCNKWFPRPRGNKENVTCPHCKTSHLSTQLECSTIISNNPSEGSRSIIVGEDIFRFYTHNKSYIKTDIDGISYKEDSIYNGSKILVRKTGVGITVGIDYNDCLTNQVVYILKRRRDVLDSITNEVILAILNSRIVTYYIIKTLGSNGWTSNAYITQNNVLNLPFPIIQDNSETRMLLSRITDLVKKNSTKVNFPKEVDAEIEFLVSKLFGLRATDYDIIFEAIKGVQQMIPFQRLLSIAKEDIFNHGI